MVHDGTAGWPYCFSKSRNSSGGGANAGISPPAARPTRLIAGRTTELETGSPVHSSSCLLVLVWFYSAALSGSGLVRFGWWRGGRSQPRILPRGPAVPTRQLPGRQHVGLPVRRGTPPTRCRRCRCCHDSCCRCHHYSCCCCCYCCCHCRSSSLQSLERSVGCGSGQHGHASALPTAHRSGFL